MKIGLGFKHHSFYYHTSESTAARGLGKAWLRQGHDVYFINMPKRALSIDQLSPRFISEHGDLLPRVVHSNSPELEGLDLLWELYDYHGLSMTTFVRPLRWRSGAFAWALSPLSPAATKRIFRYRDPLFVTGSQSYREALGLGIDAHLYTVGVDTDVFHPFGRPADDGTKFLWIGGCAPAAGPDLVLEAYFRAFTADDDVSLTMVATCSTTKRLIEEVLAGMPAGYESPMVFCRGNDMYPSDLAQLYRDHTALVMPLRFHAGCHPITEAAACGALVITTSWTAPLDYFAQDEALWIDFDLEQTSIGAQRIAEKYFCMGWFRRYFRKFQKDVVYRWAAPSVDCLSDIMRRVHMGNYDKSIPDRALARVQNHTWDRVAQSIIDVIERTA